MLCPFRVIFAEREKENALPAALSCINAMRHTQHINGSRVEGRCNSIISRGRRSAKFALAGCEAGQTMTEYAFILTLVAVVSATAFTAFGQAVVKLLLPVVKAVAP